MNGIAVTPWLSSAVSGDASPPLDRTDFARAQGISASEDARLRCAQQDGLPMTAAWEDVVAYRKTAFAL